MPDLLLLSFLPNHYNLWLLNLGLQIALVIFSLVLILVLTAWLGIVGIALVFLVLVLLLFLTPLFDQLIFLFLVTVFIQLSIQDSKNSSFNSLPINLVSGSFRISDHISFLPFATSAPIFKLILRLIFFLPILKNISLLFLPLALNSILILTFHLPFGPIAILFWH